MPMFPVVMLFRAIVVGLLSAIVAGSLFSWCAGMFGVFGTVRLRWYTPPRSFF